MKKILFTESDLDRILDCDSIYQCKDVRDEIIEEKQSCPLEPLVMPKIADLTIGQKIDAILNWQNNDRVHPLTCGCSATNNDEKKFEIVGKRLNGKLFIECSRCRVVQDWIPDCVYQFYIDSKFSR